MRPTSPVLSPVAEPEEPTLLDYLPNILELLQTKGDATAVDEALQLLCELVSECYDDAGAYLGAVLRQSDAIAVITALLTDSSADMRKQALFLCSNLASDAVDPD